MVSVEYPKGGTEVHNWCLTLTGADCKVGDKVSVSNAETLYGKIWS